jgi:hypothetical protein
MRLPALFAAATLAFGSFAAQAAPTLSPIFAARGPGASDAALEAYLGFSLASAEVAVAEGRIGNNALNGTHEVGLFGPPAFTAQSPIAAQQGGTTNFIWGNGTAVNFSLARTGTTLTFTMGNYTGILTDTEVADIDGLVFRVRPAGPVSQPSDVLLSNLVFNGNALATIGAATPPPDANSSGPVTTLRALEGIGAGNFTLTGAATLSWNGTLPTGSNLAFQIKAYDTPTAVPAPAALALFGIGLLGLAMVRRRTA